MTDQDTGMTTCFRCGFWDNDYEGCTCSSLDKWYACPIESEKLENKKELEEYARWATEEYNQNWSREWE